MRGAGHADVLSGLQVPGNKADAVPCERLQKFSGLLGFARVGSPMGRTNLPAPLALICLGVVGVGVLIPTTLT